MSKHRPLDIFMKERRTAKSGGSSGFNICRMPCWGHFIPFIVDIGGTFPLLIWLLQVLHIPTLLFTLVNCFRTSFVDCNKVGDRGWTLCPYHIWLQRVQIYIGPSETVSSYFVIAAATEKSFDFSLFFCVELFSFSSFFLYLISHRLLYPCFICFGRFLSIFLIKIFFFLFYLPRPLFSAFIILLSFFIHHRIFFSLLMFYLLPFLCVHIPRHQIFFFFLFYLLRSLFVYIWNLHLISLFFSSMAIRVRIGPHYTLTFVRGD